MRPGRGDRAASHYVAIPCTAAGVKCDHYADRVDTRHQIG